MVIDKEELIDLKSGESLKTAKKKLVQAENTKRHNKVVELLNENLTTKGKLKTKNQIAREAGVSPHYLQSPEVVFAMKPVLDQFTTLRQDALTALSKKNLTVVDYKELVDSIDKLSKNIQLLSGQATDNTKVIFTWQQPNANDTDSLSTTQLGTPVAQFPAAMESLRIASSGGEDSSNVESSST